MSWMVSHMTAEVPNSTMFDIRHRLYNLNSQQNFTFREWKHCKSQLQLNSISFSKYLHLDTV
jgi:hypothetical protein